MDAPAKREGLRFFGVELKKPAAGEVVAAIITSLICCPVWAFFTGREYELGIFQVFPFFFVGGMLGAVGLQFFRNPVATLSALVLIMGLAGLVSSIMRSLLGGG